MPNDTEQTSKIETTVDESRGIRERFAAIRDRFFGVRTPDISTEADEEVLATCAVVETIDLEAEEASAYTYAKLTERWGSNDGGWFEVAETNERLYIKFYPNPDRGRVEYIANRIYGLMGIRAATSELIEVDGRPAIASKAVPGACRLDPEEMRTSDDIQGGFVVDAYLGNYDVVGLVYDNIVGGEDGEYRIDNGGSMIFSATGKDREFSSDAIPELTTSRIPDKPVGCVFEHISESQMRAQAQRLIDSVSVEAIDTILADSGLQGEPLQQVRAGLIGRRQVLITLFDLTEKEGK
jgi:hypothetical protein